jgi:UDP:flavonoid glycosyltransferase YjiC (YdhE family)
VYSRLHGSFSNAKFNKVIARFLQGGWLSMKIAIPTIGSRGDVQPFIALAQGLQDAGHSVTLLSHPLMRALVEDHGVVFAPIGPDVDLGVETAAILDRSRTVPQGLMQVMRFAFEMLEASHEDILAGCLEADLVVSPASSAAGKNEADLLGLPYLSVNFMPWSLPVDDPNRSPFKRVAYAAMNWLVGLITTRPLNRQRRRLGLAPVGEEGFTSPGLDLIPISPLVCAPDPGWATQHRVTGYWFAVEPDDWSPPADLLSFLESGEPPLVISLGAVSLGSGAAQQTAGMFINAIQQTGMRAVVQGWEAALARTDLPPSVCVAGSLPHSWLLPRAAGLIHHGGFGTTSAGLRAGIPQLVIPHVADQYFWGQRVEQLGVGLPAIMRPKLSVERLVIALQDLAQGAGLRAAAAALGERVRAERGVDNAIRLIEKTFGA